MGKGMMAVAGPLVAVGVSIGSAEAGTLPDRDELTIPPWYAQIHAGVFVPTDTNLSVEGEAVDFGSSGDFVGEGYDVGALVGYQLTDVWAIEGEISVREVRVDDELGDDVRVTTPMVNLSARWPVDAIAEPYVAVGVGYATTDTFAVGLGLEGQDVEDSLDGTFAVQAKVGVDLYVRDANAIGLEAAWFDAGKAEGELPGRTLGLETAGLSVRATLKLRF